MISSWRSLVAFLPTHGALRVALLSITSLSAGILEAFVLLLVVGATLAIVQSGANHSVDVPIVSIDGLSPGAALAIAGVAGLAVVVFHIVDARLTAWLAASTLDGGRRSLTDAFIGASWARQARERDGAFQETATTLAQNTAQLALHLASFVSAGLGLISLLGTAIVVDPSSALAVIIFGITLLSVLRPIRRRTHERAARFVSANAAFAESASECALMSMELKLFGVDRLRASSLNAEGRTVSEIFRKSRFMTRLGSGLYRDLAVLFLIGAASALHIVDDANLVGIGSVVLLLVRALSYGQSTQAHLHSVHELRPNLERLTERIASLRRDSHRFGSRWISEIGVVECDAVSFSYHRDAPTLTSVSLRIEPGEMVGVIGPSGCGKTTLARILCRLLLPTEGAVLVDGVDYQEFDPVAWSRLVSVVPQSPRLYQASVVENIVFHRPWVSRERAISAAAKARVVDDILALARGFDSPLGPGGSGLSGGQQQRIAIARAIAGDPQLLILDEPTSALDVRSERLFQETIEALHGTVTVVLIAHRLSTLSICDRVIAMRSGAIVHSGSLDGAMNAIDFSGAV